MQHVNTTIHDVIEINILKSKILIENNESGKKFYVNSIQIITNNRKLLYDIKLFSDEELNITDMRYNNELE